MAAVSSWPSRQEAEMNELTTWLRIKRANKLHEVRTRMHRRSTPEGRAQLLANMQGREGGASFTALKEALQRVEDLDRMIESAEQGEREAGLRCN
jgi:hypothetical protein